MKLYTEVLSRFNYYAFLALIISLFLPLNFVHTCWLIWGISWLLEGRWLHRENIRWNTITKFIVFGFGVWFLWNCISIIWAINKEDALTTIIRDISLISIIPIALFGVNNHYNIRQCLRTLIISSIVSIGMYMFTYYWIHNIPLAQEKLSTDITTIDWTNVGNFLMNIKHRMHYTNLLCMSIVSSIILCTSLRSKALYSLSVPSLLTWLKIGGAIGIALWGVYLSGSRAAVLNLLIIGGISIYWFFIRNFSRCIQTIGIAIICILFIGGALIGMLVHPRHTDIPISEWTKVDTSQTDPAFEPRFAIWSVATQTPTDYIAYGLGTGNATQYMVSQYKELGWTKYIYHQYSPHNQFITICIELGLAAAILFACYWAFMPFIFKDERRYWMLCVVGICWIDMITDSLLCGLEGIVFFITMFIIGTLFIRETPSPDQHEV